MTDERTGEWVFVWDDEDKAALASHSARPAARVFARTLAMQRSLHAQGIEAELWDDFFPVAEQTRWQAAVAELQGTWPARLSGGRLASALEFRGIDLVPLVAYCVNYGLCEAMRNVATLRAALATGTPTGVHVGRPDDVLARALADYCAVNGIPFESTRPAAARRAKKKRSAGWLKALASVAQTSRGLRRLASSKSALRALVHRGRYANPVLADQAERMDTFAFDGEGRRSRAFLTLIGLANKSTREGLRAADAKVLELRSLWQGLGPLELDFEGTNLGPLLEPTLASLFDTALPHRFENNYAKDTARSIAPVLLHILHAEYLLERGQPDVVLVTHDSVDLDLAVVEVARSRNCPTAVLQHGVPAAYFPQRADRFLAWGPGVPPIYERFGEPASRYVVTGRPGPAPRPATPCATPAGKRIVTFISQPSTGLTIGEWHVHWERLIAALFEGLADMTNIHLLLRPHPSEDPARYLHAAAVAGFDNLTLPAANLDSVLAASDVVILRNSTVALDVLSLDKKLVILDPNPGEPMMPFNGFQVARNATELRATLEATLSLESAIPQLFLCQQLADTGRPATDKVYEALTALASE